MQRHVLFVSSIVVTPKRLFHNCYFVCVCFMILYLVFKFGDHFLRVSFFFFSMKCYFVLRLALCDHPL